MLTIPFVILFRISCHSPALCSKVHALFSRLLSKQSRSSQNEVLLQIMHDYSIRVMIIQPTSSDCSIKVDQSTFNHLLRNLDAC